MSNIDELIVALQDIDFGYAYDPAYLEGVLRQLENVADVMTSLGLPTGEIDEAIHMVSLDPEAASSYIYGPSDIGRGLGVLENLRRIRDQDLVVREEKSS